MLSVTEYLTPEALAEIRADNLVLNLGMSAAKVTMNGEHFEHEEPLCELFSETHGFSAFDASVVVEDLMRTGRAKRVLENETEVEIILDDLCFEFRRVNDEGVDEWVDDAWFPVEIK